MNFHSNNIIDFENRLPFFGPIFLGFLNFWLGQPKRLFKASFWSFQARKSPPDVRIDAFVAFKS